MTYTSWGLTFLSIYITFLGGLYHRFTSLVGVDPCMLDFVGIFGLSNNLEVDKYGNEQLRFERNTGKRKS